jgi:lysophospholipase L1-like esterase
MTAGVQAVLALGGCAERNSSMHRSIEPAILYVGTPVALVSSINPDGSANLAPISSLWFLGWTALLGFDASSQTPRKIQNSGECVLNWPSADAGRGPRLHASRLAQAPEALRASRRANGCRRARSVHSTLTASGLLPQLDARARWSAKVTRCWPKKSYRQARQGRPLARAAQREKIHAAYHGQYWSKSVTPAVAHSQFLGTENGRDVRSTRSDQLNRERGLGATSRMRSESKSAYLPFVMGEVAKMQNVSAVFSVSIVVALWLGAAGTSACGGGNAGDAANGVQSASPGGVSGAAGQSGSRPGASAAGSGATPIGAAGIVGPAGTIGAGAGAQRGAAGVAAGSAGVGLGAAGTAAGAGPAGKAGAAGASRGGAGQGASGSPASVGGAGTYNPCPPAPEPCKVLPFGDSITYGLGFAGAYRVELFNKAVMAGQHITFLGSLMNGPTTVAGAPFPKQNEGHSGWKIDQMLPLIPSPALQVKPDVILVMIGTNDIAQNDDVVDAPMRLGALIDKLVGAAPDAVIVVATLTPLGSSNSGVQAYNAALPPVIKQRADAGKHVQLVDMFPGFPSSELADGVHPNQQGSARMAGVWYAAIGGLFH